VGVSSRGSFERPLLKPPLVPGKSQHLRIDRGGDAYKHRIFIYIINIPVHIYICVYIEIVSRYHCCTRCSFREKRDTGESGKRGGACIHASYIYIYIYIYNKDIHIYIHIYIDGFEQ